MSGSAMHILLNALAASAGGGITYLRNVIPHLAAQGHMKTTVLMRSGMRPSLGDVAGVECLEADPAGMGALGRLWQEQILVRRAVRETGADVLISTGNLALFCSPVPQVLLTRNSLYTSREFSRDTLERGAYALWLDTRIKGWLARVSIGQADVTVAPSQAFADTVRRWTGRTDGICHVPHGFDAARFFKDDSTLPREANKALASANGAVRLLSVTHYNYFRNIETILRALPAIKQRLGRPVKLVLTCTLRPSPEWGPYDPTRAARLAEELGVTGDIVSLGLVPYAALHHVYRACDAYVTAAYAESFAHPLVESMASGLPVVASSLDVHREVCGDAALYFHHAAPGELCDRVAELVTTPNLARTLADRGRGRSRLYSWNGHVHALVTLAEEAVLRRTAGEAIGKLVSW
jgi:glycosyltransferase involved in cell wall biosynthesis